MLQQKGVCGVMTMKRGREVKEGDPVWPVYSLEWMVQRGFLDDRAIRDKDDYAAIFETIRRIDGHANVRALIFQSHWRQPPVDFSIVCTTAEIPTIWYSILGWAIVNQNSNLVQLLILLRVDVDAPCELYVRRQGYTDYHVTQPRTPLMCAYRYGAYDIFRMIVNAGATIPTGYFDQCFFRSHRRQWERHRPAFVHDCVMLQEKRKDQLFALAWSCLQQKNNSCWPDVIAIIYPMMLKLELMSDLHFMQHRYDYHTSCTNLVRVEILDDVGPSVLARTTRTNDDD